MRLIAQLPHTQKAGDVKKFRIGAVAMAITMLTACSSSTEGGSASSSSSASASASGGSATSSSDPLAEAKALLALTSENPTEVTEQGGTKLAPLTKKPDPGKLVVGISSGAESSTQEAAGAKAATEALGWSYTNTVAGNGAQDVQKAMQSALQLSPKPFAIDVSGFPKTTFAPELAQAKSMGIHVIENYGADLPATGDGIDAAIAASFNVGTSYAPLAAAVAVDSNGNGNVLVINAPAFPVLTASTVAFIAALTKFCPACKTQQLDIQVSAVGTTLPQTVVSAVQKDPSIGYVEIIGSFSVGIPAALKAAGLDNVKILGRGPQSANLEALKKDDGSNLVALGASNPIVGWLVVDSIARIANGEPVPMDVAPPFQIITPKNVSSIVLDPTLGYVGVAKYQEKFKKLWNVS